METRQLLHRAVMVGDLKRVQGLLEAHPGSVNTSNPHDRPLLLVAVARRDEAMVQLLLASGADPHCKTPSDQMNALHVLAQGDATGSDLPILKRLIKAGVDPNANNSTGERVLPLLCLHGQTEAVRWLVDRKLVHNIDATNAHGDTALLYASRQGHKPIVEILLSHGASAAHSSDLGPLQVADEFQQQSIKAADPEIEIRSLPPELLLHVLSYLGTAEDLCNLSMVCRMFRVVSRDDGLWRPLGHPSWAQHHACRLKGWKGVYMIWLRAAAKAYRRNGGRRYVQEAVVPAGRPPPAYSCTVKILMTGDRGVGKSSLLMRYTENAFLEQHNTTTGVHFKTFMCDIRHGETVRVQIWDIESHAPVSSIFSAHFRGTHGVIVPYDITNRASFQSARGYCAEKHWYAESATLMLIGCKSDRVAERAVAKEEGRLEATQAKALFVECSAKTGEGVHQAVELLVKHIAGGWRNVPGMEMPAYIPAHTTFALHCAHPSVHQKGKAKKDTKCCLQ